MTSDQHLAQRARKKRKGYKKYLLLLPLAMLLCAGVYATSVFNASLKPLRVVQTVTSSSLTADEASAQQAVDDQWLPTAIGWEHNDTVWSNDDTAYSLASISKLVTMLVCLEEQPLDPDTSSWPSLIWSEEDWIRQQEYLADDGVVYPIEIGTEIALEDVFYLIFLPSSNDYASSYAYSVFGDNDTFIEAVTDWGARHGLNSLEFVEPTGMDEGNKANVGDLVRLGRMALNHPVISQFISTQNAYIPGIGYIENTNPLLPEDPSIVGVKTGRSMSAGFNFIAAATEEVDGREVTRISATMKRGSIEERAQSGREMLYAMSHLPVNEPIITAGQSLGKLITWDGHEVSLVASDSYSETLLPGERVSVTVDLHDLQTAVAEGDVVGGITVTSPAKVKSNDADAPQFAVIAAADVTPPGFWWRLKNPQFLDF